jgi:hypothetical protein
MAEARAALTEAIAGFAKTLPVKERDRRLFFTIFECVDAISSQSGSMASAVLEALQDWKAHKMAQELEPRFHFVDVAANLLRAVHAFQHWYALAMRNTAESSTSSSSEDEEDDEILLQVRPELLFSMTHQLAKKPQTQKKSRGDDRKNSLFYYAKPRQSILSARMAKKKWENVSKATKLIVQSARGKFSGQEKTEASSCLNRLLDMCNTKQLSGDQVEIMVCEILDRNAEVFRVLGRAEKGTSAATAQEVLRLVERLQPETHSNKGNASSHRGALKRSASFRREEVKEEESTQEGAREEEDLDSSSTIGGGTSTARKSSKRKTVSFGGVRQRYHTRSFGESVPFTGPALGLGWAIAGDEAEVSLEEYEQRLGEERGEEPNPWYFEEGQLDEDERVEVLQEAGVYKGLIDLNSYCMSVIRQERRSTARSKTAKMVIEGQDPDAVEKWEAELLAAHSVRGHVKTWRAFVHARRVQRAANDSGK